MNHNFKFLYEKYNKRPKKLFEKLAQFENDFEKIDFVMDNFKYIKNKGARDFLIGAGMVTNVIAFDDRVLSILKGVGIELPKDIQSSKSKYRELEDLLLTEVCYPIKITGGEFDRILYQNADEIKKTFS